MKKIIGLIAAVFFFQIAIAQPHPQLIINNTSCTDVEVIIYADDDPNCGQKEQTNPINCPANNPPQSWDISGNPYSSGLPWVGSNLNASGMARITRADVYTTCAGALGCQNGCGCYGHNEDGGIVFNNSNCTGTPSSCSFVENVSHACGTCCVCGSIPNGICAENGTPPTVIRVAFLMNGSGDYVINIYN